MSTSRIKRETNNCIVFLIFYLEITFRTLDICVMVQTFDPEWQQRGEQQWAAVDAPCHSARTILLFLQMLTEKISAEKNSTKFHFKYHA